MKLPTGGSRKGMRISSLGVRYFGNSGRFNMFSTDIDHYEKAEKAAAERRAKYAEEDKQAGAGHKKQRVTTSARPA